MRVVGNIASDSEVVATASGAITAGKPVVVNADGTVKFAGQSTVSTTVGSATTFDTNAITGTDITFDSSNNKVVVSFKSGRTGDYGVARVGTVDASNNTISFGTETVFESAATGYTSIDFDSTNNKVLIAYRDGGNSYYGTAIVGTVSGTDISFGSPTVFESASTQYITTRFDPDNSKFLIVYRDNGNSQYGTAIVATISGTSVSFGSATTFNSVVSTYNSCIYDTNANKFLVTYRDIAGGSGVDSGYARVATISGTSVSFGSATAFHPVNASGSNFVQGTTGRYGMSFDSTANKVVIAYEVYQTSTIGYVVVGTISGTSVSFGTPVALGSALEDSGNEIAYDSNTNKHLIMNYDNTPDPDQINVREVTISGTTPTLGSKVLVSDLRESSNNAMVFDSNAKKIVLAYAFGGNSNYGTANVVQTSGTVNSLTSENFIGFAKDNVADGAVATIQTANSIARDNIGEAPSLSAGSAAVYESAVASQTNIAFVPSANKFVIVYQDEGNSSYGTAVVATISGTSVTYGSPTVFNSDYAGNLDITVDTNVDRIAISYTSSTSSNTGRMIIGTVSGTSLSFGSTADFNNNTVSTGVAFDSSNNKVVVAYEDDANSDYTAARVATIDSSDNSVTFGTEVNVEEANTAYQRIVFDSNSNKVVVAYRHYDGSAYSGRVKVGTVSGTNISFGDAVVFNNGDTSTMGLTFDTTQNHFVIAYRDQGDSNKLNAIIGTVDGTSISFGTEASLTSGAALWIKCAYDSNADKVLVSYQDGANSDYGTAVVATASTDLTIGQTYFVQNDGTLSTSADSPSVTAGTAISSTDLIVKG